MRSRLLAPLLLLAGVPASAAPKAARPPDPPAAAITEHKDKLIILGDGKQHFVALVPFGSETPVFYGDGKRFFALRVGSSSRNGDESFDTTFWEPRVKARYQASLGFKKGEYFVQCEERLTALRPLPAEESKQMVASAQFFEALWRFRAYALARDDRGTYYYVDKQREPEDSRNFRLFAGQRGNMKPLKMVNVVSDSEGEIFSTKTGDLRLVLDKRQSVWVKGKKRTSLTSLPIEDNAVLIYTDLGAYTGQRLGTPCDDL
jgi:hypothetical protein